MADKTVLDLEANMIYQLVSVLTLYVDDIERSLHGRDREFRFGKKMLFKRIKESAQAVGFAYDELMGDIIKDAKTAKNYQEWQEESNYLARVLLLYIEKISPSTKAQSELYDWLKQREGGLGILGEDELKRFYIQ